MLRQNAPPLSIASLTLQRRHVPVPFCVWSARSDDLVAACLRRQTVDQSRLGRSPGPVAPCSLHANRHPSRRPQSWRRCHGAASCLAWHPARKQRSLQTRSRAARPVLRNRASRGREESARRRPSPAPPPLRKHHWSLRSSRSVPSGRRAYGRIARGPRSSESLQYRHMSFATSPALASVQSRRGCADCSRRGIGGLCESVRSHSKLSLLSCSSKSAAGGVPEPMN
mmetsp:Transcript_16051/g.27362  ORF Transcript_16051/g.27362 Transcript_16051/m.27362 type:complete len:226 (+) Transcript_16051:1689-2366(+)